ncbi:MAG: S8 family peptidase [Wenzhouxiangellaceae bacterium]
MTRFASALFIVLAAAAVQAGEIQRVEEPIADHYIVVLNSDSSALSSRATASERRSAVSQVSRELAADFYGQINGVFADTLRGFAVRMSRRDAASLAQDPRVAFVAEDQWVQGTSSSTQFDPPSWGLDRVDQRDVLLDGLYQYVDDSPQADVHVYVIDSGIHYTHEDFGSRVDTVNGFNPYTDGHGVEGCHGHGTHVAGTIGGTSYGVAKNVTLHPIRVLNCWNGGPLSAVIMGVDWVTARMIDEPHAAIANMSLITSASQLLDDAVRASIAAGVTYVVAAGNNSADACNYSPARIAEAITVGASTPQDSMASNSNYGACVDLFAPGTGILSAYNGSDTDSLTLSGTSMSSAHVSGIAATLLAQAPGSSPVELTDLVIANATQLPSDIDATGNNLLAYSFVELEPAPENNPVLLDVHADCNDRNRRCMFEAIIENNTVPVDTWFWDFGDGAVSNRYRAKVGHAYASDLVEVTVLLTVLLSDGQSVSAERTVTLPAFYARCCA